VSDTSQGPGWWIASDGKWYPPDPATSGAATADPAPAAAAPPPAPPPAAAPAGGATADAAPTPTAAPAPLPDAAAPGATATPPEPGWWLASDGNWYPPQRPAAGTDPATTTTTPAPDAAPSIAAAPAADPSAAAASTAPAAPVDPSAPADPSTPSGKRINLLPVLIGVVVVFVVIAAAVGFVTWRGRGSELAANGVVSGPDELPSSDLTLAEGAVVVRGGGGVAVRELSTDGRTIVLDAGAEGADQLEDGDVMVLTGITAGKVTSVDRSGDEVRVSLEPAAITDIISDGELSWDEQQVDFSTASLRVWEPTSEPANKPRTGGVGSGAAGGLVDGLQPAMIGPPVAGALALVDADPLELAQAETRSGEVGGYRYSFTPRVTSNKLAFDLTVGKDADGYAILIESTFEVTDLTTDGALSVNGGSVTNFAFDAPSVNGKATIDATASTGPQYGQGSVTAFEVPLSIDVPLVIAGIPFTLGIGAALSIEPAFSAADASVTGKLDLSYSGSTGMSVSGGSLSGTGAFNPESTSPEDVIGGLSLSPVAVIVHLEFPQISFGLGTALARASANFNLRSSVGVQFSGSTHVIPCAAQNQAMVATADITGELLGTEVELGSVEIFRQTWDYFVPDAQACVF
jgi:hypothetical protein